MKIYIREVALSLLLTAFSSTIVSANDSTGAAPPDLDPFTYGGGSVNQKVLLGDYLDMETIEVVEPMRYRGNRSGAFSNAKVSVLDNGDVVFYGVTQNRRCDKGANSSTNRNRCSGSGAKVVYSNTVEMTIGNILSDRKNVFRFYAPNRFGHRLNYQAILTPDGVVIKGLLRDYSGTLTLLPWCDSVGHC